MPTAFCRICAKRENLWILLAQVLDVDGLQVLLAVDDTGLGELLTTAHLFHHAGFLEFAFQFLESSFEVVTFFNRNYDHC